MVNLSKIVDSVEHRHRNKIPVREKDIEVVYPGGFDFYNPYAQYHVSLGNFYEYLTRGMWGGRLQNNLLLKDKNGNDLIQKNEGNGLHKFTKPDIIHHADRQIGESKAVKSGESANLLDDQVARYKLLQAQTPDALVYFAFYRHGFQKIKSFRGTEEELFAELSGQTYHSVVLPLSLIMGLHEAPTSDLVYRYDGEGFHKCTCVRSPTLNRFLTEPKKVIEELNQDPNEFVVKRYSTPRDFNIGGNRILSFPVMRIFDKSHKRWMKTFHFEVEEESPEFVQEYEETMFDYLEREVEEGEVLPGSTGDVGDVPF